MEEALKKRRRKTKKQLSVNYFDEDNFRNEILPKIRNGSVLPNSFVKDIFSITDGMINTEFRNNVYVLENREDLKHECFLEVLKSLKRYDGEKGRSFAYFNRIIKNTLLKWYHNNAKIQSKEVKIVDVTKEFEGGEDFTDEESLALLTSKINVPEQLKNQNSSVFSHYFDIDASKENKIQKRVQDPELIEYSLYKYLSKILKYIDTILLSTTVQKDFFYYIQYKDDLDVTIEQNDDEILEILKETQTIFKNCVDRLDDKIKQNPEKYNYEDTENILINNKVLVYSKNKISDKNIRKPGKKIIADTKLATSILILMLSYFDQKTYKV